MTVLLLDIMEFNEFYIEVLAYFTHRLVDLVFQLRIKDEANFRLGIAFLQHVNQAGKCRTVILAILNIENVAE